MIIFHKITDLQAFAHNHKRQWENSAFIPTMGALHQGHISLIEKASLHSALAIASIFVNPTQFNDPKDFEQYPITISKDIQMLEEAGCDVLFLPSIEEMYPEGLVSPKMYDLGSLENLLEGFYRPGHFQGVCRVVHKLLNMVNPASLYMGEKDFQQCIVVQRLIESENLPVKLITCPTLREEDGLAMSSRNMRLTESDRKIADTIYRELQNIKATIHSFPLRQLEENAAKNLLSAGFRSVDYISIAEPATLEPLQKWQPGKTAVVLAAAFLGDIRLIDNQRIS